MDVGVRFRRAAGLVSACAVAAAVWMGQGAQMEVHATTIYGYTDDKGNPVYTDSLQQVPEKHRSKVRQFEQTSKELTVEQPSVKPPSDSQGSFMDRVKNVGAKLGAFRIKAGGLSEDQLTVLNYAGVSALFLLVMMYLSKESPMIRLLAMALLIVLGIGTPVLMYTGKDGALSVIKQKTGESAKLNEDRLRQTSPP